MRVYGSSGTYTRTRPSLPLVRATPGGNIREIALCRHRGRHLRRLTLCAAPALAIQPFLSSLDRPGRAWQTPCQVQHAHSVGCRAPTLICRSSLAEKRWSLLANPDTLRPALADR